MGNVEVLLDARAFRGAICRCVRQEMPSSACCLSHLASLPLSTDADVHFPYLVLMPRLIDCNFANPFCFAHVEVWPIYLGRNVLFGMDQVLQLQACHSPRLISFPP